MAGVNMENDSGRVVGNQQVPSISPDGAGPTGPVVASEHLSDGNRAEGVAYNENPGVDVDGPGSGFPGETDVGEANNPLKP